MEKFEYRGFVLKEGKKYRWSGFEEGHYRDTEWKKLKCKIIKIDGDKISIKQSVFSKNFSFRDSPDEVVEFSKEKLDKLGVKFQKRWF